jgi:hypothetical protein
MKFEIQITAEDGSELHVGIESETDLPVLLESLGVLVRRYGWTRARGKVVAELLAKLIDMP